MPGLFRLLLPLLPLAVGLRAGRFTGARTAGLGAAVVLALGLLEALTRRAAVREGQGLHAPGLQLRLDLLTGAAWLVGLTFGVLALGPFLPDRRLPAALAVAGAALLGLRAALEGLRRRAPLPRGEERHWLLGLLYLNPRDRTVLAPARLGPGYAVNLGRPLGWLLLLVAVGGAAWAGAVLGRVG